MTTIQAHRLIHDHGVQGREAKQADEQRKPELSAPQTDQATEEPDPSACGDGVYTRNLSQRPASRRWARLSTISR
jgi:hypothetical protein